MTERSYVVTGGSRGVGREIATRLAQRGHVVVLDVVDALDWHDPQISLVSGDARDAQTARRAAARAESAGPLVGWVNNAAIFQDAALDAATSDDILAMITANVALAVTGCHTAVNHFLARSRAGAIVNVSSHQAVRPGRGGRP